MRLTKSAVISDITVRRDVTEVTEGIKFRIMEISLQNELVQNYSDCSTIILLF